MIWAGHLESIHVAPAGGEPMRELRDAALLAGIGIEGDRYATGRGRFSEIKDVREITLIEAEALEALSRDLDMALGANEHRRNLTTRGVPLNHLVGRRFRVGEALLEGGRLNQPCNYLQSVTGKKVKDPLANRTGLNCRIVEGGIIHAGDPITPA
jgi:hypothetical protein